MVYVCKSLLSYRVKNKTNERENILVDFQLGQQHISVLCSYKPPSVNNNIFTDEMYTLLDAAISNQPNIICLGDLNCDILHPLMMSMTFAGHGKKMYSNVLNGCAPINSKRCRMLLSAN